eukprot:2457796-Pyramimonas_sp.AAC.1
MDDRSSGILERREEAADVVELRRYGCGRGDEMRTGALGQVEASVYEVVLLTFGVDQAPNTTSDFTG